MGRARTRVAAGALVLALAGCAHGLDSDLHWWWRVCESQHFTVYTDGYLRSGVSISELERSYGLLAFFFGAAPRHIDVVAFDSEAELIEYVGYLRTGAVVGKQGDWFTVSAGWRGASQHAWQHELTHRFLAELAPQAPYWWQEGMALYLETVRFVEGTGVFGEDPGGFDLMLMPGDMVTLSALVDSHPADFEGPSWGRYNRAAWALVHYLVHEESRALARRLPRLVEELGKGSDGRTAFARVYAERPFSALADGMDQHVRMRQDLGRRMVSLPGAWPATVDFRRRRPREAELAVVRRALATMADQREGRLDWIPGATPSPAPRATTPNAAASPTAPTPAPDTRHPSVDSQPPP